ncbi:NADPH-dependent FMN reductase [Metabacillus sp. 113a]|uniref:NADPH-dependent FMN reductase n=1 Tax=Metabacillus sp. 113a TaxID=3404706 RepID=UPI003CEDD048
MQRASPEYQGGMPGAIKNAPDFLDSSYFARKPVALVSAAGGGRGGIHTLHQMRTIMQALCTTTIAWQLPLL